MKLIGYMIMGVLAGPVLLVGGAYLVTHPMTALVIVLLCIAPVVILVIDALIDASLLEAVVGERREAEEQERIAEQVRRFYRPADTSAIDPVTSRAYARYDRLKVKAKGWADDETVTKSPFFRS